MNFLELLIKLHGNNIVENFVGYLVFPAETTPPTGWKHQRGFSTFTNT